MKKKKKVTTAEILDLPEGMMQAYTVEIFSGKEALFSGDFEISQLEPTRIKLKNREHCLELEGNDLTICDYEENGIHIRGTLSTIHFSEDKKT